MMSSHQIERVAGDDLAKADERRAWLKVVGLHDPHRPTPGNVDRVIKESRYAVTRIGRVDQFDLDTLAGIEPERVGGVERRVKHGAEIFSKLDWHDEDRSMLGVVAIDGVGRLLHRDPAGLDRSGPFFNFGLDEFLQIFRRAALARDEIGADLLHPRLYGGGVDGRERGGMKLADDRRGRSLGEE